MKKLYELLELKLVQLEEQDVITSSGPKVNVGVWGKDFDTPVDD